MMSSNNNFLLKIHMEEEGNITEIYLNKERRSFTFVNDECISDLIIPEFKITSLHMILKNISDANGEDNYYAEYEDEGKVVREYDQEKIELLSKLITKIKIEDFLDYQKDININEYYVDNVIDAYDCVLPIEMKKILSYTTNGVVFNGDETFYFMPHDDITNYDKKIKNFIPFMIKKGKNYIGYDFKDSLYKEYSDNKLVNDAKTLEEIIGLEELEVIGAEEERQEDVIEELVFDDEETLSTPTENLELIEEKEELATEEELEKIEEEIQTAKEDLETEIARIEQEYEETIKNIDYQFERLNNGIVQKDVVEPYQFKEKEPESSDASSIKEEIRTGVRKALDEIDDTNDIIDEIDNDMKNVVEKAKKIKKDKKAKQEQVIISDEVGREAEEILKKLNDEIANLEKAKQKAKEEKVVITDEIGKEAEMVLAKLEAEMKKVEETQEEITKEEVVITDEIGREAEKILAKLNAEMEKSEEKEEDTKEEIAREAQMILQKLESEAEEVEKAKTEAESKTVTISEEIGREAEMILAKLNEEAKKVEEAKTEAETNNIVISEEIGREAEKILAKLNSEMEKVEKAKTKADKDIVKISDEIGREAEKVLAKINSKMDKAEEKAIDKSKAKVIISDEIGQEAAKILAKLETDMEKLNKVKEKTTEKISISEEIAKAAEDILEKLNAEVKEKERLIEEVRIAKEKEKAERKKVRELKAKQDKEELLSLTDLVNNSIYNAFDNYMINFNDTQKLVVEHLPYYEFNNDFNVIQIPEIEYEKITILPNAEIDLGRIKLKVNECLEDSVEFVVESAVSVIDKAGNKVKKEDKLVIALNDELNLRINKKQAMESWSLKVEKSTFEKELRNIDFKKIMNLIIELDSYKELGNIEKYELQKSVMLFLDFVMDNKDTKALDKLYEVLNKKNDTYEEYITKYNIENSLKLKDSLSTYEEKKAYLTKLNYVNGLIDAKWLDYPRYIFNAHNYFERDDFLEEFVDELNKELDDKDFYNYLMKLFNEYEMFNDLDEIGKENLDKCIDYLSKLYKHNPDLSEDNKYKLEKSFMIGATEEEMALLISKLCRRGIIDYSSFVEYNANMREKYLIGELKYPIYSEYFEIEEIRNGGEYDEF